MKKKSLLILTMATILCFSNIVQAFAIGGSDLISKEEFTDTMTELYNKYGLNFEVVDDSNYNSVTREVFESELSKVEKSLVDAINIRNENNENLLKLQEENGLSIVSDINTITPDVMEIFKYLKGTQTFTKVAGLAWCNIAFETMSSYNGSNGEFISVESPGTWYKASSINCNGITYNTKKWFITSNRTQVIASADGTISYTYIDPIFGMEISAEQPFAILKTFGI